MGRRGNSEGNGREFKSCVDRQERGPEARRINGNQQLLAVGTSLGCARDLRYRGLPRVYGSDVS